MHQQRQDSANQPHRSRHRDGIPNRLEDGAGNKKNAGPDNSADDHQDKIPQAENSFQLDGGLVHRIRPKYRMLLQRSSRLRLAKDH